ncbi:MAG: insulinase family protein, partial [Odoribacter sp.]|nr:insulinase family protein [Odoribacter sp.]
SMPQGSYWCVTTDVNACHTEAAIAEILHEIERLRTEEVPEEELRLVRRFLHGTLLREVDGIFSQSDSLKNKLNYGLDNGIYSRLIESIHRTTPAELRQLARKYWNPEEMYIVTAGTISKKS